MAITGGVKIFNKNQNLFEDGASGTATSGSSAVNRALDKNPVTKWRSVGSTDAVTETIIVTLPTAQTIDRILLVDHNWKEFTVKYDVVGVFTDFTTVVGLDGALGGGITETVFADNTAYYEFDAVSVTILEITVTKTQIANAEKFITQIISTDELGTLEGFPLIKGLTHTRNSRRKKMLSGKTLVQKSEESLKFKLQFKNYPGRTLGPDLDLMFTLFDREENFIVWLSGGRRGTEFFRYTLRGFRLEDVPECQVERDYKVSYTKNVYIHVNNVTVSIAEAV